MARTLSQKLQEVIHVCHGRKEMTWRDFLEFLRPLDSALLTLIFSVPFILFVWFPGLNRVLAAVILVSGIRIALNKPIWLPNVLRRYKISGNKMAHRLIKWVKFLKKVEKTIHPRGTIYQQSPFLQTFNGFILSVCGFFLFMSLSPMANFLPACAIFLLSIAILEEDLFLMIGAYIVLLIKMILLFLPYLSPATSAV